MDDENQYGEIIHWQFQWLQPGPLDLDNLPTSESVPPADVEPQTKWEAISQFNVDSGKMSVFDKDMMEGFIDHTGDERLVIDVCQDPFSSRMGYQGVLPGGFFSASCSVRVYDDHIPRAHHRLYSRQLASTMVATSSRVGNTTDKSFILK